MSEYPRKTTSEREQQHRRSIKNHTPLANIRKVNVWSYPEICDVRAACVFEAVQNAFSHISIENIRTPPHAYQDAQLARQIAIRILAHEMEVEQRHISRMQNRQRTAIHFAIQAVNKRMEDETFAAAYDRMAAHALMLYEKRIEHAA